MRARERERERERERARGGRKKIKIEIENEQAHFKLALVLLRDRCAAHVAAWTFLEGFSPLFTPFPLSLAHFKALGPRQEVEEEEIEKKRRRREKEKPSCQFFSFSQITSVAL